MNEILYNKKAAKQLVKLKEVGRTLRLQIDAALEQFPNSRNVKKLHNHEYTYRLRVNDFRIFFEHDSEVRIIYIEKVERRNERTYK